MLRVLLNSQGFADINFSSIVSSGFLYSFPTFRYFRYVIPTYFYFFRSLGIGDATLNNFYPTKLIKLE